VSVAHVHDTSVRTLYGSGRVNVASQAPHRSITRGVECSGIGDRPCLRTNVVASRRSQCGLHGPGASVSTGHPVTRAYRFPSHSAQVPFRRKCWVSAADGTGLREGSHHSATSGQSCEVAAGRDECTASRPRSERRVHARTRQLGSAGIPEQYVLGLRQSARDRPAVAGERHTRILPRPARCPISTWATTGSRA